MTVLKAILLTLLLICAFSLAQVGFVLLFYKTQLLPEYFQDHFLITVAISFVIAYVLLFKIFWKPKLNIKNALDVKTYDFRYLTYFVLIILGLQLLNRPFWDLDKIWSYIHYAEFDTNPIYFNGFNPAFIYRTISILIIGPILEELFFRKFLLKKLLERNSQKVAILVSSLCFALIHIETPYNLIPTFFFGIISSLIFIASNKIWYSILLHFLFNLLLQIFFVFDFSLDLWLLDLNFNYIYWMVFIIGAGVTYITTRRLLITLTTHSQV